jgi:flagellar export protein FliJ
MFRFRLDRVLQHRQRIVEACTRELAEAQGQLEQALATVAAADAELARSCRESARAREGVLTPESLARLTIWHDLLVRRRDESRDAVEKARALQERTQAKLQTAWRDREVLERLKEKQRQEWLLEDSRRQRRALDEIGAIRAAQQRQEDFAG